MTGRRSHTDGSPSATGRQGTYRLQLRPDFGFEEAAQVADYLFGLGVTHLYLSPCLQAARGSTHGYDVVDHGRVSRELGGPEGFGRLHETVASLGLGLVLDLVPNHMAISGPENEWWWDVLENGPSSVFSSYFDVDWEPPEEKLRNQVLLPVLPDHYGRILEAGDFGLERNGSRFNLRYGDLTYPLSPRSVSILLERTTTCHPSGALEALASALADLPEASSKDDEARIRRRRLLNGISLRLERLLEREEGLSMALDRTLEEVSSNPDLLDAILEEQNYRIAYWRAGNRELDYRRFFDIDHLVALRVERPEVFEATHRLALEWVREGVLDGLRIDHVDGLRRPRWYLQQLRARAPDTWIVVEKILEPGEALRPSWDVQGTTGYDFLNDVGGLLVDSRGEGALTSLHLSLAGEHRSWQETVLDKKRGALDQLLAADLARLAHLFVQVCEGNRRFRDFTRHELREALREVAISLPVYRTYVEEDGTREREDLDALSRSFQAVRDRGSGLSPELLAFLEAILSGERGSSGSLETELRMQFQQLTGAVMAKGVEDTAFYTWVRLLALNEVGGDPGRFGLSPEDFHHRCRQAGKSWPESMLALSTHDTKRSEDVRARLFVLSEIPGEWGRTARRWMEMNSRHRTGDGLPDGKTEYLLYQTLVGAHPLPLERAGPFMMKAVREGKEHTSWRRPDTEYEEALHRFLEKIFDDAAFQEDLAAFSAKLVGPGRINSLAQKLVQLTAPGVPDLYQGTELWDLSLVDPDNRRAVDFALRREALEETKLASPETALRKAERGDPKMRVVHRALALRRERPAAFSPGSDYQPVYGQGSARGHMVGFIRSGEVMTLVPRLVVGLRERGGWKDTTLRLPNGSWVDRMTGETWRGGRVPLSRLLGRFPVALLALESGSSPGTAKTES